MKPYPKILSQWTWRDAPPSYKANKGYGKPIKKKDYLELFFIPTTSSPATVSAEAIGRGESGDFVVVGQGVGIVFGVFVAITSVVGTCVISIDMGTTTIVGFTLMVNGGLPAPYAYFRS